MKYTNSKLIFKRNSQGCTQILISSKMYVWLNEEIA
jgi:hypothetical protein